MPPDPAGEDYFFEVAALLQQVVKRVAMGDAGDVLLGGRSVLGVSLPGPVIKEKANNIDSELSDLRIQALLASMLNRHQLQPPDVNTVYVLFLGKGVQSKTGEQQGGREFLAYHNHFHASQGVVRYLVVPFDTDLARERRSTVQGILAMLLNPDGPAW